MANIQKVPREQHPEDNWSLVASRRDRYAIGQESGWDTSKFSTAEPRKGGVQTGSDARAPDAMMGVYLREENSFAHTGKYGRGISRAALTGERVQ